jgi:hypothetical protein
LNTELRPPCLGLIARFIWQMFATNLSGLLLAFITALVRPFNLGTKMLQ